MNYPSRFRLAGAGVMFALALVLLAARATQLAVVKHETLQARAQEQQQQQLCLESERGAIVDREGRPLALAGKGVSVYVRPAHFRGSGVDIRRLARVLGLPESEVKRKVHSSSQFVWLKRRGPWPEQLAVESLNLRGVGTEVGWRRYYPQGDLAAPVLGFTGVDGGGLEGIERLYDAELRGEEERVVVGRDARGRRMLGAGIWRPRSRSQARVELTIDASLQSVAEAEIDRSVAQYQAAGGLVVMIDPLTGEILALAQAPRFNPGAPDMTHPERWRNRAVTDSFEPGSTMKAFTAAAALEAGAVRAEEMIYCEHGRYRVGRRWIHDHEPQDWLTFAAVLQHSSNIGMAKVAERLGPERLAAALRDFGFGQRTGVDLPGETKGLFPNPARWRPIRLATVSFGQGIAVTGLQLARAFAALANGGVLMRPFVVKRVVAADGSVVREELSHVDHRAVSARTARLVTALLEQAVEQGTGTQARIPGIRVAGKTGTAQRVDPRTHTYSRRDWVASFVGFAPAQNPRVVIAVVVDRPRGARYGGVVAAPIFRRIAERALDILGVGLAAPPPPPRPYPALRAVALPDEPAGGRVPNVIGLGMRDAARRLAGVGVLPAIEGWGAVVWQDPLPGAAVTSGSIVHIKLGLPSQ